MFLKKIGKLKKEQKCVDIKTEDTVNTKWNVDSNIQTKFAKLILREENVTNFRSRRWGSSLPGLRTRDPPLSPPST